MATTSIRSRGPRTRGAQVLAEFLPLHEEHAPQGFGLAPHAAVLQVADHVGDAARLACEGDCAPMLVAVPLTWAGAAALAAIPRLDQGEAAPGARAKDALLLEVDRVAADRLSAHQGDTPAQLVGHVTAALGPAFAALALIERERTLACDGLFPEPALDETEALERVGEALLEVAVGAVVAADLLERASVAG